MDEPPRIVVWSQDAAQAAVWSAALKDAAACVLSVAELSDETPVDVLLVGPITEPDLPPAIALAVREGHVGVVRVGGDQSADVLLPEDASPREVQLACELLSQIVRLRRQHAAGDRVQRTLTRLALTDPLTGIPNRRAWDEELGRAVQESDPQGRQLCVAVLDLDGFKKVNAHLGYAAGDAALKDVARRLTESIRRGDFLARLGGDEFGIVFWGMDPHSARTVVDRVRRAAHGNVPAVGLITASAGVALAPLGARPDRLLAMADIALRQAKREGGDCVSLG